MKSTNKNTCTNSFVAGNEVAPIEIQLNATSRISLISAVLTVTTTSTCAHVCVYKVKPADW